jgi:hypothetical protein
MPRMLLVGAEMNSDPQKKAWCYWEHTDSMIQQVYSSLYT